MKLDDLLEIINTYPTIIDIDQEIYLIKELQSITLPEIKENSDAFIKIVFKIQESHNDNGIFEVTKKNENVFMIFANWLISIAMKTGIKIAHFADGLNLGVEATAMAMQAPI